MIEIIITVAVTALLSVIALYLSKRSLTGPESMVIPKEKIVKDLLKKKATVTKKAKQRNDNHANRAKPNKNEKSTSNNATINKVIEKKVSRKESSSKFEAIKPIEVSLNSEWMEVGKKSKKAIKSVKYSNEDEIKPKLKTAVRESIIVNPTENANDKSTKGIKQADKKTKEVKEVPKKVEKPPVTVINKPEPVKEVITNEAAPKLEQAKMPKAPVLTLSEDSKLRQRIGELMTENDKLKQNSKEDIKNFTATITQLSKESEQLRIKLKAEMTLNEDLKKRSTTAADLKTQVQIFQQELTKSISNCDKLNREKAILENEKDKLEAANISLNKKLTDKDQHHDEFINQIKVEANRNYQEMLNVREKEFSNTMGQMQGEKQKNIEKLLTLQNESIEKNNQLKEMQQELLKSESRYCEACKAHSNMQKEVEELRERLATATKRELTDANMKKAIENLNAQLCDGRDKINELEKHKNAVCEENKKLLNSSENDAKMIESLKSEIEDLKKETLSAQQTASTSSKDLEKEISELQKKLQEAEQERDEVAKHVSVEQDQTTEMLNEKVSQLENEVDKYKTGLEKTEAILSELQNSVNDEENKWKETLLKSESEAEKSKLELERVYKDIMRIQSRTEKSDVNFAYQCVDKSLSTLIDEMESRMGNFQESLDKVMQERDDALHKLSETDNHNTAPQLNGSSELNHSPDSTVDNKKLLEDLKQYEDDKKMLENQCNKFKTLVDIGKDALEAEKAKVKNLQEELNKLQSSQENTNAAFRT